MSSAGVWEPVMSQTCTEGKAGALTVLPEGEVTKSAGHIF